MNQTCRLNDGIYAYNQNIITKVERSAVDFFSGSGTLVPNKFKQDTWYIIGRDSRVVAENFRTLRDARDYIVTEVVK
tara:strand:+ start:405 stop:635 length:231 start_codon:yes stop_codon:yes gene_type:complete